MLPMIAIGIGGTGKWVLTDVKKNLVDAYGNVPEKVALLEFDLLVQENIPVERAKFDLEQGKMVPFTLDYDPAHREFFIFCEKLTDIINSVKNAKGDYSFIEKWFGKEEAEGYVGESGSCAGAGQIRSLSRTSFFLHPQEIYERISSSVRNIVAKRSQNEIIPVFIISSLAGGTGCGTFIDFANIVHKCFSDLKLANVQYHIFGIFILPRGFQGTIPSHESEERFETNCFSAFREMHRFNSMIDQKIQYAPNIDIKKDFPLYDIVYFIDGEGIVEQNGRPTPHYLGLCPAISEYIMTYVEGIAPIDALPKIIHIGIRPYFAPKHPQSGELDIPIYSTFGVHKYILEIDDIKIDFAHRLGKDILNHFIEQPVFAAGAEVQAFMKGSTATPLLRNFFYQTIENPGFVGTDKKSLINHIKFNSEEEDIDIPLMRTDDIPTITFLKRVNFKIVKTQADNRYKKVVGSEDDMNSPDVQQRSTYGVLNYYIKKHEEKFSNAVEEYLIQMLNAQDRKGSLLKAGYFLKALIKTFDDIIDQVQKMFNEVRIEDRINTIQSQINKCKKDKRYLELTEKFVDSFQHQLTMNSIIKIAERDREICKEILTDVDNWIGTFKEGIKQIDISNNEHIKTRRSKRTIKCWTFVTDPSDKFENKIYELMKGDEPQNSIEKAIKNKLPAIRIETLVDPRKYFTWKFELLNGASNSQIRLSCLLPENFKPLESLKNEPIKWNYSFINNYLILGKLDILKSFTIMDALALKGEDPARIASNLKLKSSLFANVNSAAQVRGSGEATNTEHFVETIASFTTTEPGRDFAQKFAAEIEKETGNVINDHQGNSFPYMILQLRIDNYIKYSGFTGLTATSDSYAKEAIKGGYHVFPEEINALKIESKFKEVFHEEPNFLNCKVVNLIGDIELVRSFTYALKEELIKFELGTGEYTIEIEEVGEKKSYPLGKSMIEALGFLLKEDAIPQKARKKIKERTEQLKRGVNEHNIESFIENLTEFFRKIDPSGESDPAEKDLLKVMKVIMYEEIENYKKVKKAYI